MFYFYLKYPTAINIIDFNPIASFIVKIHCRPEILPQTLCKRLLARVPERVRVDAPDHPDPVPAVPSVAARVDAVTADAVSAAACEKLAEDAAQTTLMVVEFQRWYREQRDAYGTSYAPR